jgi:hypothetical protein
LPIYAVQRTHCQFQMRTWYRLHSALDKSAYASHEENAIGTRAQSIARCSRLHDLKIEHLVHHNPLELIILVFELLKALHLGHLQATIHLLPAYSVYRVTPCAAGGGPPVWCPHPAARVTINQSQHPLHDTLPPLIQAAKTVNKSEETKCCESSNKRYTPLRGHRPKTACAKHPKNTPRSNGCKTRYEKTENPKTRFYSHRRRILHIIRLCQRHPPLEVIVLVVNLDTLKPSPTPAKGGESDSCQIPPP